MLKTKIIASKHFFYCLIAFLLFVFQVTPGFFSFFGVRPVWLVSFALCIASFEGEFIGPFFGLLCGFFADLYGYDVHWYYSLMLFVLCFILGLLVKTALSRSWPIIMLFVFFSEFLIQFFSSLFQLAIIGEPIGSFLLNYSLPISFLTAISSFPLFFLVRAIYFSANNKLGVHNFE